MSLTIQKNVNITRSLTATVDGRTVSAASFSGQITPDKAMGMSMVISNAPLAIENRDGIIAALDAFMADLRVMAAENGLPV